MSAETSGAIAAIQSTLPMEKAAPLTQWSDPAIARAAPNTIGFSELVSQGLEQVNRQLLTSQTDLQNLAAGNVQNLHQIMIRLEESKLSFQLMMQVRSRLLEAYQDVMKMQL
jgi:flagellar hook-basal body complex protein FliE